MLKRKAVLGASQPATKENLPGVGYLGNGGVLGRHVVTFKEAAAGAAQTNHWRLEIYEEEISAIR
jgi:hypothetical protein